MKKLSMAGQREVIFPYTHAEAYMTRNTFAKAIKQLVELGFIEKSDFGGLYRRTNIYKFSFFKKTGNNLKGFLS